MRIVIGIHGVGNAISGTMRKELERSLATFEADTLVEEIYWNEIALYPISDGLLQVSSVLQLQLSFDTHVLHAWET